MALPLVLLSCSPVVPLSERLRVLHVIPSVSDKHGGPTYALHAFSRAAQAAGINVVVATTDDDGGTRRLDVPLGEPVERRGVTHFFFKRDFLTYKISGSLGRWLQANVTSYDLVHIHALFSYSSYAASRAARAHNVPYIVRPLGVLNRWGMENRRPFLKGLSLDLVELPILRNAAAIHYTSQAEQDEAVSLRAEIGSLPAFVVPIPVDPPPNATADEFLAKYPSAAGKKLILFLSRLDAKKGLELLLEAFAAVHNADPDVLLVIAGDGRSDYVDSLMSVADRLHLQSKVLWCGHLGPDMKAAAFAATTIFVLPSHSENFGIAAAEALAAGVPTVVSQHVAIAKEIGERRAGLVVPAEPLKLAEAIQLLLHDEPLRRATAENARVFAAEAFSPAAVGAKLAEQYREIVNRR